MASKLFGSYKSTDSVLGYLAYAANITQATTAAPSATVSRNDFSPTTFTWARVSAGIYTLTTNNPTFTSGKCQVIIPSSLTGLTNVIAVITSSTVITFTTNVTSVITTVLSVTPTDNLFNTFLQIQVWD